MGGKYTRVKNRLGAMTTFATAVPNCATGQKERYLLSLQHPDTETPEGVPKLIFPAVSADAADFFSTISKYKSAISAKSAGNEINSVTIV